MRIRGAPGLVCLMAGVFVIISIMGASASLTPQEKVRVIITANKDFDEGLISALGGRVVAKGRIFPIVIAELPPKAVGHMKRMKGVVRIEYDTVVCLLGKPSTPPGKLRRTLPQPEQQIPWGVARIKAPEAWNLSNGSASGVIEVAILDTGIDLDHPDLRLLWYSLYQPESSLPLQGPGGSRSPALDPSHLL